MQTKTRPITEVTIKETTKVTTEEITVETTVVVPKGITEATNSDTKAHATKSIDKTDVVDKPLGIINTDSSLAVCIVIFATNLDTHHQPAGFENNNVDHLRCPIDK